MNLLQNRPIVAGLTVIAVGACFYNVVWPYWSKTRAGRPTAKSATVARAPAATAAGNPAKSVPVVSDPTYPTGRIDQSLVMTDFNRWVEAPRRDPFQVLVAAVTGKPDGPTAAQLLTLRGTWHQTGGRCAVLNTTVVQEGDAILDFQVQTIESDAVTVKGPRGLERIEFRARGERQMAAATPARTAR